VTDGTSFRQFANKSAVSGPDGSFFGVDSPPESSGPNRCTQKLSFSPKVMSKSDRISGPIPPGVYRRATAVIFPPRSAPPDLSPYVSPYVSPDLSPDSSLGLFLGLLLDLHAGLSLDPVRFQLLPLWPWPDHTPECRGSATPNATIPARTLGSRARLTDSSRIALRIEAARGIMRLYS